MAVVQRASGGCLAAFPRLGQGALLGVTGCVRRWLWSDHEVRNRHRDMIFDREVDRIYESSSSILLVEE